MSKNKKNKKNKSQDNENKVARWKSLGFMSEQHYQGWLSFNDLESKTHIPQETLSDYLDDDVDIDSMCKKFKV